MELLLPALTKDLDATQVAWLTLANNKGEVFKQLQADELKVQEELKDITLNKDLKDVQLRLSTAKSLAEESKGRRLHFTSVIQENIINKAMDFEKRSNILISAASAHELELRKEASKQVDEANRKNVEIANLKAHIQNEHFRIAAQYRQDLKTMILESYANALTTKVKPADLPAYKTAIKDFLADVKLVPFNRFPRVLIGDEEAMQIFQSIPVYNAEPDLTAAIEAGIDDAFAMYEQDFKSKTSAVQATKAKIEEVKNETQQMVSIESSTNLLSNLADVPTLTSTAKTKKSLAVEEVNSPEWAKNVTTAFLKHWVDCVPFLRTAKWPELKVGQMAAALGKLATERNDIKFTGLNLKEVEK